MVYFVTNKSICGGVVLNENTVLTAAHCLKDVDDIKLYVGFVNRLVLPKPTKVYQVIIHPEYDEKTLLNDLAIVKIRPLTFTSKIRPIPLYPYVVGEGAPAVVKGWGVQRNGQLAIELRELQVETHSPQSCVKKYGNDFKDALQICAGDSERDFCIGDSGGPLVVTVENTEYLVGIVSYTGRFCADGKPSVYTRIFHYLDWIEQWTKF